MGQDKFARLKGNVHFEIMRRDEKIARLTKALKSILRSEVGPMAGSTQALLHEEAADAEYDKADF